VELTGVHVVRLVVAESLAERALVDFTGRRHRHLGNEHDVVRQPPARDVRPQVREHRLAVDRAVGPSRHDEQRPLLPLRMERGHHRGLHHVGMAARRVLERDRADPLAAGLDEVLRPIDDRDVAVLVDRGDVARDQPSLAVERFAGALEVARRDPRALRAQVADRHAVVRERPLHVVDDAKLRPETRAAGFHTLRQLLFVR